MRRSSSTLDLHDDIKELAETVYNPFVVPGVDISGHGA